MKDECIAAVQRAAGRSLSKGEIDGIESRMTTALRDFSTQRADEFMAMSPAERVVEAAKLAKERMMKDVAAAQETEVRNAQIRAGLDNYRQQFKPGLNGQLKAVMQRFFYDAGSKANETSVEMNRKAIMGDFMRYLSDVQKVDTGKFFGLMQDLTKRDAIFKELAGEASGDPEARKIAQTFLDVNKMAAQRAERAGIGFHELDNWRSPQSADWTKVALNKDEWLADHMAWIDRRAYVMPSGERMTDAQLRDFLGRVWETQATNGANKRASGEGSGYGGLGTSRQQPRQLHYKDAASFIEATNKYGRATNVYSMFMQHFNGLSRDISIAETLGRDHETNFGQMVEAAFAADIKAVKTEKDLKALEAMKGKAMRSYDLLARGEGVGNQTWATRMAAIRSVISSTMLGGLFGAVPDFAMTSLTAKMNGISQIRAMGQSMKGIVSKSDREMLDRVGLSIEGMQSAAHRFGIEELGHGAPALLNEAVHKLSLLGAFDRGMRSGIGLSMMDLLGKLTRDKTLADLQGGDHEFLVGSKGVTEKHWAVWKAAEVDKGADGKRTILSPDAIYKIPNEKLLPIVQGDIAARSEVYAKALERLNAAKNKKEDKIAAFQEKFGALEAEEIERAKSDAVTKLLATTLSEIQAGARGAAGASIIDKVALGLDQAKAGTVNGEIYRMFLLMKQTPLGIAYTHLFQRPAAMDTMKSAWMYRAQFMAYSTLLGAVSIQLKAMATGEDPAKATEGKFWAKALMAGGGMGIYGDLLFGGGAHTTNGLAGLLGGPGAFAAEDAFRLYNEAGASLMENGQYKYGSKFLEFGRKYAAPLTNIWYTKAAFNHLIYHNLQEMLDPGWAARMQAKMQKRHGTSYWWSPGGHGPDRAPDLSNMLR